MNKIDVIVFKNIFEEISFLMDQNKDKLTDLDAEIGDGDLGLTMTKGFRKVIEVCKKSDLSDVGELLIQIGISLAETIPSTMGTLLASGFLKSGSELREKEFLSLDDLRIFFDFFIQGIILRGKAKIGEKTVIDSLNGCLIGLKNFQGNDIITGMNCGLVETEKALEDTKLMQSVYGKAAVFGDKTIGKIDPGAFVGKLIVEGFCKGLSR